MSGMWADLGLVVYHIVAVITILYVAFSTGAYLLMYFAAAKDLRKDKDVSGLQYSKALENELAPLSILVPAYNEGGNIVSSARSLLSINYKQFEVIVINDGSKDDTAQRMIDEFDMSPISNRVPFSALGKSTAPIRNIYRSLQHPNLVLVDKENGGKADALNAGINVSRYPYFASLDGDTVLDTDAFIKVMKPIMEAKPGEEIVATGGSVGIANGSIVDTGYLSSENVLLSRNPYVVMQVIEYLRGFLMGRIGLSSFNMLILVSGAFGVFKKSWVIEVGGYETETIGEDMELIVRLHRLLRKKKSKGRIIYIPEPVCWTEAPESRKILRRQRIRWQRGLFESLWRNKDMLFNPRYGRIGFAAMPLFMFVELLGPVVELIGLIMIVLGLVLKAGAGWEISASLSLMMILYGSLLSTGAVLFEEWRFHHYNRISDVFRLVLHALSESFWYRPMLTFWRVIGLAQAIRGKKAQWGEMTRVNVIGGSSDTIKMRPESPLIQPKK